MSPDTPDSPAGTMAPRRRLLAALAATGSAAVLVGCAALGGIEPPRVVLVGLEPLQGEGMELRFAVRLRVQNPNPEPLRFDGVSLELDLRGRSFASGVAPLAGAVPGWGETVLSVPVTVSAFALARQLMDLARGGPAGRGERIAYALRGHLGGSALRGGARFAQQGEVDLGEVLR